MARASALPLSERVWQPDDAAKLRVRELVADFSIEVTPATAGKHATLADLLPAQTRVYIAFVPGEDHRAVAAAAARVRAEGLVPVPHFPARSILDRAQLDDYLRRGAGEAGVDEVLTAASICPAAPSPGPLPCSRPECSRRAASAPSGSPGTLKASVRWLRLQPR